MAVTQTPAKPPKGGSSPAPAKVRAGGDIRITLVRSVISHPQPQREVVKGLGLRKLNSSIVRKDGPEVRGMIRKVAHLVKVEALDTK